MRRSYLLRRPADDDMDYGAPRPELVEAKPIDARLARALGPSYSGGRDFVKASSKSQQEFYGSQEVLGDACSSSAAPIEQYRQMTHDERNKLSASIIKAELKGDKERVKKLRTKLEQGVIELKAEEKAADDRTAHGMNSEILMEMDRKSGLTVPAERPQHRVSSAENSSTLKRKGTVNAEYERQMSLNEMLAAEKRTTAEDQITMFGNAAKVCAETRTDDDSSIDDNLLSHPKKRRHEEKESRQREQRRIQEHKFLERTLGTCSKCIESGLLERHTIVATGIKTYLAVINWNGLSPDHCYIAPMGHYASSVVLDEDVWEEMRLWMKGLMTMWRDDDDQDCVFVENAVYVREQRHMVVECIPLSRELGDMAPVYFKKAILECEKEWSDNKKLIELAKNPKPFAGVRGLIPKGFPYFAINFGLQPGYAHVIEDETVFPANFAQEILGGMTDADHRQWKNPKRQSFDEVKKKRDKLKEKWMSYDWTEIVKHGIKVPSNKEEATIQ